MKTQDAELFETINKHFICFVLCWMVLKSEYRKCQGIKTKRIKCRIQHPIYKSADTQESQVQGLKKGRYLHYVLIECFTQI